MARAKRRSLPGSAAVESSGGLLRPAAERGRDEARSRAMWKFYGQHRPSFAAEPGSGQESVWDYPRPPVLAPDTRLVEVRFEDRLIARSERTVRVLETASPPTFYIPPEDVDMQQLRRESGGSLCEWKGRAAYWSVVDGPGRSGWSYPDPTPEFEQIQDWFSFYPALLACTVAGERVEPQPGGFYGGWMTDEIVGPVKGEPGTGAW